MTRGPGRYLSGFALSPQGSLLEIPADIEVPVCECGMRVIDENLKQTLHTFERAKIGDAFPIL